MRFIIALIAAVALLLAACGNDDDSTTETEPTPTPTETPIDVSTPVPADTPTEEPTETPEETPTPTEEPTEAPEETPTPIVVPTGDPPDVPEPVDTSQPAFGNATKLSTVGLGDMYFGMTPDEAATAVNAAWTGGEEEGTPRCYLLAPANGPTGVVVTVYNSTIERVDINNPSITTRSGASVGSTEAQLHELFGARLVVIPYADGSGNSIQYVPVDESDIDYRVIFETDGTSVTSMRAGRLPAVAPTQPCT